MRSTLHGALTMYIFFFFFLMQPIESTEPVSLVSHATQTLAHAAAVDENVGSSSAMT